MRTLTLFLFFCFFLGCLESTPEISSEEVFNDSIGKTKPNPTSLWDFNGSFDVIEDNTINFLSRNKSELLLVGINKNLSWKKATLLTDKSTLMFESMFTPQRPDYPGVITQHIECPPKYKPRYYEKNSTEGFFKYFIGFANSNYVPGACSDDLIKHNYLTGMLYCKSSQTLYGIDYFTPLDNLNNINELIQQPKCNEDLSFNPIKKEIHKINEEEKESKLIDLSCPGCNLIIITPELLRADHVGLINGVNYTPSIDTFFNNSIVFTQAMAPSAQTYPSISSTFASKEVHELTYTSPKDNNKSNNFIMLPMILEKKDYNTQAYSDRSSEFSQAFNYDTKKGFNNISHEDTFKEIIFNEKFFIFYHTFGLHQPSQIPKVRIPEKLPNLVYESSGNNYRIYYNFTETSLKKYNSHWAARETHGINLTNLKTVYNQKLKYEDLLLKEKLDLITPKYLNNTIIILYSNHGDSFGDNNILGHGHVYQAVIRAPLLIKHPHVTERVIIDEPISLVDLVPTILEMLEINNTYDFSGRSLIPLIQGETYWREQITGENRRFKYIREGDWKIIMSSNLIIGLYNLTNDPNEESNLFHQYPGIAQKISQGTLGTKSSNEKQLKDTGVSTPNTTLQKNNEKLKTKKPKTTNSLTNPPRNCYAHEDCGEQETSFICITENVYKEVIEHLCWDNECVEMKDRVLHHSCNEQEICKKGKEYCQEKIE